MEIQDEIQINPTATRPLEYVGFFTLTLENQHGPIFMFLALDAYSGSVYNLGREDNENPETVQKKIYYLLEDPVFVADNTEGFTLVMERYKEQADSISKIISFSNGRVMFNKSFNDVLFRPLFISFSRYLTKTL